MTPLTLALVPLDERPVNTRIPSMLGAIAGVRILLPPPEIRGHQRLPADLPALETWLTNTAPDCDAALVSCDFFAYGNLINARISSDSAARAISRLLRLAEINQTCPVHAFSLITRVSNADDAVEEPVYWAQWGTKCYAYARLIHQRAHDKLNADEQQELADLEGSIPPAVLSDWLTRRLRNHTVNLTLLDMAARGDIASLLLTSDDTSLWGFPSRERDWLSAWVTMVGPDAKARVCMYPGADEVGAALLAARISARTGHAPKIWTHWAIDTDTEIIAPYEDRPIRETVAAQIAACGCAPAARPADADIVLGVATPSPRRADYRPEFLDDDRASRAAPYARFAQALAAWQAEGKSVALADVAYPNGADPLLMELLLSPACLLDLSTLVAYGAWNTAGNTLGVVVAEASCARHVGDNADRSYAQCLFLAHRFLEDWGYQTVTRRMARADAEGRWGRREPDSDSDAEQAVTCGIIAGHLETALHALQARGIGVGLRIVPGSVSLPWHRTFEVDFTLD